MVCGVGTSPGVPAVCVADSITVAAKPTKTGEAGVAGPYRSVEKRVRRRSVAVHCSSGLIQPVAKVDS